MARDTNLKEVVIFHDLGMLEDLVEQKAHKLTDRYVVYVDPISNFFGKTKRKILLALRDLVKAHKLAEKQDPEYPRTYGAWAGKPNGSKEDPRHCVENVWGRGYYGHQCHRKRLEGSLLCKQHQKSNNLVCPKCGSKLTGMLNGVCSSITCDYIRKG